MPELREDIGKPLTYDSIAPVIEEYRPHIDAICFLGHGTEAQSEDFIYMVTSVRLNYKNLLIGLYSGFDKILDKFKDVVDFYKVGRYIKEKGGLDSPGTNQRMYRRFGGNLVDVTHEF